MPTRGWTSPILAAALGLLLTACSGGSSSPDQPALFDVGTNDKTAIVAFGDGIASGAGSTDGTGYRDDLERKLANGGRLFLRVIDGGEPGTDTADGAARIGAVLARDRPAALLLLYGTNDAELALPASAAVTAMAAAAENLRAIIQAARANKTLVVLATLPPACGNDREAQRANIIVLNDRIRALALEMGATDFGVLAADPWTDFLHYAPPDGCALIDTTGVLPMDSGYAVLASSFSQALEKVAW